jgi:dTMP kinase
MTCARVVYPPEDGKTSLYSVPMQGKLIVIDGADGSGKATQARMLADRLRDEGIPVETLDFPRYTENFFGKFLRECLDGKHGDFVTMNPRIASTLYAADRYESSTRLREWLQAGTTVVLDRYVSANMMHQGSKIKDESELQDFLTWLDYMEHEVFRIPRPDIIVHLDVPHTVRKELVFNDTTRNTIDTVELDDSYQIASEECARRIVANANDWRTIVCTEEKKLRSPEDIHEELYQLVRDIIS